MQKLTNIKNDNLSEKLLKVLAKNGINTILDFLQEDTEKLCFISNLSLSQVLDIRKAIFTKYSAPLISGFSIYEKSVGCKRFLETGLIRLDNILGGGIPIGYISEVCGVADSGKTQLCFQLAINAVKNTQKSILYIDTKGDFSAVRIQKNLDAQGYSHKEMANILFKIKVIHIWSIEDLVELFRDLKNRTLCIEDLSLIIVDSLPALMFQFLGDGNKIGLSLLNTLVNYSRFLLHEFSISIVFINIQTRWVDSETHGQDGNDAAESSCATLKDIYTEKRNRCLGKYWQQIPTLVLLLEKTENTELATENAIEATNTQIKATVLESCFSDCNQFCYLNLDGRGIT